MKNEIIKILLVILVVLLVLILPQNPFNQRKNRISASEQGEIFEEPFFEELELPREPSIPGRIEGTGTYFKIDDSEYLNITLKSTEKIKVGLESIPKMISLDIEASPEEINSTIFTIGGLESNKTYFKYQDSYRNEAVFVSNENGSYSWTQDLSQPHHIWIQEVGGTIFLPEDCELYGVWEEATSTCTLNQDLTESMEITTNNITLDCNGYSITGGRTNYGIYLNNKTGVTIKNCTVSNFSYGIYLYNTDYSELLDNITNSHTADGIRLHNSSNNTVINNNCSLNNDAGILLWSSSESNTISNNNCSNNKYGIYLWRSPNNEIYNNNISNSQVYGIILFDSSDTYITDNNINSNGIDGIVLLISSNIEISNNKFINDGIFLGSNVASENLSYFNTHIIENNTINEKPIYYYKDTSGIKVPEDAGSVILANCDNMTVENINTSFGSVGIELAYTENSKISNNEASNNVRGIYLHYSSNNNISENNALNNIVGVYPYHSSNNKIYHNNFIDNSRQAYVAGGSGNLFDDGYPSGGNYWSDYTGVDLYSGLNQDQPGSDGIGDTPYTFSGGQDNYPFMRESGWEVVYDLGFRANPDGFKFKNLKTKGTWEMFEQFFGREATTLSNGEKRYVAEQYFKEKYKKPQGSCYGFSVSSLINFEKLDQPNTGSFAIPYYDILYSQDLNDNIQDAIAYYQRFQSSLEPMLYAMAQSNESGNSPNFYYEEIKENINNRQPVVLLIAEEPEWWGIWQKGGRHAVVPYRYEELSENEAYVYVYDSNHPGDNDRKIIFDLKNDEWSYEFKKFLWLFPKIWEGDSSYQSIIIIPLSMNLHKGVAPWTQNVTVINSEGPASLLFIDKDSRRIGFVDGEFVDEIPEAIHAVLATQDEDELITLYYLPEDLDHIITLHGTSEGKAFLNVFGNYSLIQIKDATVYSTTIDNVKIGKDSKTLTYTTNDNYKEYSATITEELTDTSRIVTVNTSISADDITTLEITDEQTFKYTNTGNTKTYNLILEQRGTGAGQTSFSDLTVGTNATHIVGVADWNNLDTTEIILEIDENSDGIIDEKKTLQITFEDPKRGTKLTINTIDETFQFIAPDKEFPAKKADWMKIIELSKRSNIFKYNRWRKTWRIDISKLDLDPIVALKLQTFQFKERPKEIILIKHSDEELKLFAIAVDENIDFCLAHAKDVKIREHYLLIDRVGKEERN